MPLTSFEMTVLYITHDVSEVYDSGICCGTVNDFNSETKQGFLTDKQILQNTC